MVEDFGDVAEDPDRGAKLGCDITSLEDKVFDTCLLERVGQG